MVGLVYQITHLFLQLEVEVEQVLLEQMAHQVQQETEELVHF